MPRFGLIPDGYINVQGMTTQEFVMAEISRGNQTFHWQLASGGRDRGSVDSSTYKIQIGILPVYHHENIEVKEFITIDEQQQW